MNQPPFVTIPLRDGTQAAVSRDGVRVGERTFALTDIQDARQVAPDPETVALRVANERHGVELQPAQAGDGALLLEALFRLRPELRPAGFDAPATLPPDFPPLPVEASHPAPPSPWGAHPSWPPHPGMYPPLPSDSVSSTPPMAYPPYAPRPAFSGGRLSPYPRNSSDLIGAIFELFMAHWRRWLLLGLVALLIPEILSGAVDAIFHVAGGNNLWAGVSPAASQPSGGSVNVTGATLPSVNDLSLLALNLVVSLAIGALLGGWTAASLGIASRDALFGRAPEVGAALRAGVRRVLPAMGASILATALTLLILLPLAVLYGIMLTQFSTAITNPNSIDPSSSTATAFTVVGCLSLLLLLPSAVFAIHVHIRLILSPYIAATESLGPVAALGKSWKLTRGYWWHTFLPIFVIAVLITIVSFVASFVQNASFGAAVLFAMPLAAALIGPLGAISVVAVLYDVRLRREGYATLRGESNAGEEPVSTAI